MKSGALALGRVGAGDCLWFPRRWHGNSEKKGKTVSDHPAVESQRASRGSDGFFAWKGITSLLESSQRGEQHRPMRSPMVEAVFPSGADALASWLKGVCGQTAGDVGISDCRPVNMN